jgi:hypothetical protein
VFVARSGLLSTAASGAHETENGMIVSEGRDPFPLAGDAGQDRFFGNEAPAILANTGKGAPTDQPPYGREGNSQRLSGFRHSEERQVRVSGHERTVSSLSHCVNAVNPRDASGPRVFDPLEWIHAVTAHIPDRGPALRQLLWNSCQPLTVAESLASAGDCAAEMKIISFITDARVVDRILRHLTNDSAHGRLPECSP